MDENEFIKTIFSEIVVSNLYDYNANLKYAVDNPSQTDQNLYIKSASIIYSKLDEKEKSALLYLFKVVITDTISNVFGIIDGTTSISDSEFELSCVDEKTSQVISGDLQDLFLELVEEDSLKDKRKMTDLLS